MNPRIALLIAVPLILVLVIALTLLGFFSSYVVVAVLVVLYVVVSWANRKKFAKQEKGQGQQK
jgi:positive regulator of sigma E activity